MSTPSPAPDVEGLLRDLAPRVLGALVRRNGRFEDCEDAVQEAVLAATTQWPAEGVPGNPRGWLTTVAARRLADQARSDLARRERRPRPQPRSAPARSRTPMTRCSCCSCAAIRR